MEDASKRRRELEAAVLDKVGEVISAVRSAKRVDQVICALHSLAVLLFPLDYSSLLSGQVTATAHVSIYSFILFFRRFLQANKLKFPELLNFSSL